MGIFGLFGGKLLGMAAIAITAFAAWWGFKRKYRKEGEEKQIKRQKKIYAKNVIVADREKKKASERTPEEARKRIKERRAKK